MREHLQALIQPRDRYIRDLEASGAAARNAYGHLLDLVR